jgi:Flp pilus assembly protein TadG
MTTNRLIATLRDACRRFAGAKDGNTVITFALAFIPLMGLTGAAVDYSRANQLQTAMQAAADTAALMVAQTAAAQTSTVVQTTTNDYYRALFSNPAAQNLTVTGTYSNTNGSTVFVSATATYRTAFMGIMGFATLPLAANSTASFGNSRLRVALVLDNTGSMGSSNKMTALKNALNTANTGLLDQLKAAATNNGDVYVSIVPFVKDVNVGSGNYNASWIYWDDAAHLDNDSWDAQNGSCTDGSSGDRVSCLAPGNCSLAGYTTQASCQAATGSCNNTKYTTQSTCTSNGYCSISTHHSQSGCNNAGGTWRTPAIWTAGGPGVWTDTYAWTPANHNTWNGCVVDRGDSTAPSANNYDTNLAAPTTSDTGSLYAAEQYGSCPQAVMGLSYNWTAMKSLVNNMSPNGNTNQAIGLQLGWMSLFGGGPFTMPAEDANYTYQHVIILLTDGLNTEDRWYTDQTSIDNRQAMTCANAKAPGVNHVTIYTIQVNTDGSPTSTLLQNCATDSSKFFLLTSSSQIVTTFAQIGTNLSKLRIAK